MKYQINPITVDATKIAGVGDHHSDGSIRVLLEGKGPSTHGSVVKRHEMMGLPKVGDYYVTNEDGTHNLVPRAAFEATHTCIDDEAGPGPISNERLTDLADQVPVAPKTPFADEPTKAEENPEISE
jgi:hypothetical protein